MGAAHSPRDGGRSLARLQLSTSLEQYLTDRLAGQTDEIALCLLFGPLGQYCGEHAERGTPAAVALTRNALLRAALDQGARYALVAHNHPSGESAPSAKDVVSTRALHRSFNALGICLFDHVIVAHGGALFSFRREGLI